MLVRLGPSAPLDQLPVFTRYQPWATLMAIGAKCFEGTRQPAPATFVNSPVIISAATSPSNFILQGSRKERMHQALESAGFSEDSLPLGTAVGSAYLLGCYRIAARTGSVCELTDPVPGSAELSRVTLPKRERLFGHFSPDRWFWQFSNAALFIPDWEVGTIRAIDYKAGYGFIRRADGTDAFFHFSLIRSCGRPSLDEVVRFRPARCKNGVRAIEVRRFDPCCEVAA